MGNVIISIEDQKTLEKTLMMAAVGALYCSELNPTDLRAVLKEVVEQYQKQKFTDITVNDLVEFIRTSTGSPANTEIQ